MFTFRKARVDDILRVMSDSKIMESLSIKDDDPIVDDLINSTEYDIFRAAIESESYALETYEMLVQLIWHSNKVVEAHIACPRSSVVASRALILSILVELKTLYGVQLVFTTCPKGIIANTCRKVGMINVGNVGEHKVYAIKLGEV